MPLSSAGLWLAESITPNSPSSAVRYATPGVGMMPSLSTSTPAPARPATTAASRNSPEALGSRPTRASGRRFAARAAVNAPASPRVSAAAAARSMASRAVRSCPATPRTPSVPNSRPIDGITSAGFPVCGAGLKSALGVLRRLAGLLQTVLLALLDPGVAGQETGLLQGQLLSGSTSTRARAMPRRSAPACPDTPPPVIRAMTSKRSSAPRATNGSLTSCWCTLFGK